MPTMQDVQQWTDHEVRGPDGEKIGKIDHLYVDRDTGEPTFAAVTTGLFGMRHSLVPIDKASFSGDHVSVPYDKATVKDAPNIDADGELSEAEEERLYAHYGLSYGSGTTGTTGNVGRDRDDLAGRGAGHDTSGPDTDDAMTRSEEEVHVATTRRETGRARLRKYVVTEDVTRTVPVSREEVRIEREPITDANVGAATRGPDISSEEHEVTLHAEEPVVEKRVVPKERVRAEVDTVTDEIEVDEQIRKERIDVEGDARDRGDRI
jgi:uncharacterized protein (TIGR02271 family)